jgi:hypothetical protein
MRVKRPTLNATAYSLLDEYRKRLERVWGRRVTWSESIELAIQTADVTDDIELEAARPEYQQRRS